MGRDQTNFGKYVIAGIYLLSILGIASCGGGGGDNDETAGEAEIIVVSWGGTYSSAQRQAFGENFGGPERINWIEYNGGLAEIRNQITSGKVEWDIVDVLPHEARVGCNEGLFQVLDRSQFAPAADGTLMDQDMTVPPANACVVPQIMWSYVTFFEFGQFGNSPPVTIADFFDLQTFPGTRAIQTWPNGIVEMALVADGVSVDQVYTLLNTPAGVDRAFAMLDSIRDDVTFWSSGATPLDMIRSGAAVFSTGYNGRVSHAILNGSDFVLIFDGQVLEEEWLVLLSNAPNTEAANRFLIHASAPEQQAAISRYIPYGPLRVSAHQLIEDGEPWYFDGQQIWAHIPNREELLPRSVIADPDWWAINGDAIAVRYQNWRSTL